MDGSEGMTLQGSTPYYLHTSIPVGYNRPSNPNLSVSSPAFNVQGNNGPTQGFTITLDSSAAAASSSLTDPIKKKRGRPRKYGPDGPGGPTVASGSGTVSLDLLPSSPNSITPADRKKRGRPPGSGRKQRLASVGEWMSNSAGAAFMPHVIHVQPGEDIAGKLLSFSQQRPRALCIMSGSGGVSAVTLRQPGSSAGTVTFEGRFEILCLSGSYLVAETGGPRSRTGGVNVSLSSPDGHVIGGAVSGTLVASRPVQVVVCSFIYGIIKGKGKESDEKDEKSSEQPMSNKTSVPISENFAGSWPDQKIVDSKNPNPNTDIDLESG
ncbi:AT-hook motif nuclear-localized protein 5-like [Silene latifolia]|uniref:AT-hook motif nuclear-localized protein 5-like n=1 Tax=Silene latifolia TaxID=37657 RepID=UPI003D76BD9C